jgi:hypothetical protein
MREELKFRHIGQMYIITHWLKVDISEHASGNHVQEKKWFYGETLL